MDYSAIRFSKTMAEEFDDLKKRQGEITEKIDGVHIWYLALVRQEEEAKVKATRKASAAAYWRRRRRPRRRKRLKWEKKRRKTTNHQFPPKETR